MLGRLAAPMPATVGIVADAKLALRGLKDALAERVRAGAGGG